MTLAYALTTSDIRSQLESAKAKYESSSYNKERQLNESFIEFFKSVVQPNIDQLIDFLDNEFEKGFFKPVVFENIFRVQEITKNSRYFIQIFLTNAKRKFNPLVDPCYLIEGYVDNPYVDFKAVDSRGKTLFQPFTKTVAEMADLTSNDIATDFVKHFSEYVIYSVNNLTK